MNNRLLKKLRKEARKNVKIHPNGFEETLEKQFGEEAPVYIIPDNMGIYIQQLYAKDDSRKIVDIDGVSFFPDFLRGQYVSEDIPLREARRVLPILREMYVVFHAGKIRKKVNRRKYRKAYNNFVKKIDEI